MSRTAKDTILAWNPGSSQVAIFTSPDTQGATSSFKRTGLAANTSLGQLTKDQLRAQCFIDAMVLIVRDQCDPIAVHNALVQVQEYRQALPDSLQQSIGPQQLQQLRQQAQSQNGHYTGQSQPYQQSGQDQSFVRNQTQQGQSQQERA